MTLLFLILELIGLWIGTEILIKRVLNFSDHFGLSHSFLGLTIISIGTDLPEFIISVAASTKHLAGSNTSGIIVGNALGSCFAQISIVLALSALVCKLTADKKNLLYGGITLLGSILVLFLFFWNGKLGRIEGAIMIMIYAGFIHFQSKNEKLTVKIVSNQNVKLLKDVLYLLGGLALVIVTSNLVVISSMDLAESWGVKQSFIGIVILGLGSSLPELAVSLNAAFKNAVGLSVGNLIGSNIFDLLIPMGIGAVIVPMNIESGIKYFDLPFLLMLTLVVLFLFRKGRQMKMIEAALLIAIYLVYILIKV